MGTILEISGMFVTDLKINRFKSKRRVYVTAHISDDPGNEQKTADHQNDGKNLSWTSRMRFRISSAWQQDEFVVVTIKREGTFGGEKVVGTAEVSLKEVMDAIANLKDPSVGLAVTRQVKRGSSGKIRGQFNMNCKLINEPSNGPWVAQLLAETPAPESYGNADVAYHQAPAPAPAPNAYGYGAYHPTSPAANAYAAYHQAPAPAANAPILTGGLLELGAKVGAGVLVDVVAQEFGSVLFDNA